jgi:NADH-quinone oxidoreductase subunit E
MSEKHEDLPPAPNPMAFAMAWTAFGLGVTAQMLGAMSQAFASAGHAAQPKPPAKAEAPLSSKPKETAKVLSFETAVKAKTPKPAAKSATKPDNLKIIDGIGPKLEQVLNQLGILTFSQIAAWTSSDISRIDDQLKLNGRIVRDDWAGQARKLAEG